MTREEVIRNIFSISAAAAGVMLALPAGAALACDKEAPPPVTPTILTKLKTDFSTLKEFQNYIAPYKERVLTILDDYRDKQINIFATPFVKNWAPVQNVIDWDFYAEMLLAVQLKYDVPGLLVWPGFLQESGCATAQMDTKFLGPMRIAPLHYNSDTPLRRVLLSAHEGWDMLSGLPQRFRPRIANEGLDYEELLKAGAFIRYHADVYYPGLPRTEAAVAAFKKYYSGDGFGNQRVNWYQAHRFTLSNPAVS